MRTLGARIATLPIAATAFSLLSREKIRLSLQIRSPIDHNASHIR
jgi:hypothetical protein